MSEHLRRVAWALAVLREAHKLYLALRWGADPGLRRLALPTKTWALIVHDRRLNGQEVP